MEEREGGGGGTDREGKEGRKGGSIARDIEPGRGSENYQCQLSGARTRVCFSNHNLVSTYFSPFPSVSGDVVRTQAAGGEKKTK